MKIIKFDEIKDKIKDNEKLWVIGERKWSISRNANIFVSRENGNTYEQTGIFLTDKYDLEKLKDCTRLIFFNSKVQHQFIAVDYNCNQYLFASSSILNDSNNALINLKNVFVDKSDKHNFNFKFSFAKKIGAIHKLNINDKIKIVLNKNNGEWRLYHE